MNLYEPHKYFRSVRKNASKQYVIILNDKLWERMYTDADTAKKRGRHYQKLGYNVIVAEEIAHSTN